MLAKRVLTYLLCLLVFTMLLTPDVKHILPWTAGLYNNNRAVDTTLTLT